MESPHALESHVEAGIFEEEKRDAPLRTVAPSKVAAAARGRRKDKSKAPYQLAEEARLRAKQEALENQRLVTLRTGSLYDYISPPSSAAPTFVVDGLIDDRRVSRPPKSEKRGVTRGGYAKRPRSKISLGGFRNKGSCGARDVNISEAGYGSPPIPATKGKRDGISTARPSRLEQTLHRYRYFADPVTSQKEALRSLQAKNSLYPTLRFSQPWDGREIDPLDEYMSSSGGSSSNEDDEGGRNCDNRPQKRGARAHDPLADIIGAGELLTEGRREMRDVKRKLRLQRQYLTQARRAFNSRALAVEEARKEAEAAEIAEAAEEAEREAGKRPPQVDVSKLAHFRYSKIKETLPLGSEEDWASDKLYEGSSRAESEMVDGHALPAEFFGSGARPRFYDIYRLVHRQKQTVDDEDALEDGEFTPRRLFIRESMAMRSTPSPAMMRSKFDPRSLDLGFQGLGDKIGLALAATLPNLPLLTSLSLRDNRLTDASLGRIIAEAVRIESLTSLDLSSNKIDDSALVLREYVASSRCTLHRLSLSNADVDDNECKDLMEALATNLSISALDLSHNMIGDKETYNFVRPDYTTGGEAVAEMLETNVKLAILDLSWNTIRMASGVSLGQSLAHNSALVELKLAHNSLADEGSQAIAQSLRSNSTLKLLDVSFNNLKPRSAMVLANALLDNISLDRLMMSHNNVGRSGARAVFMALRQRARPGVKLLVDLESCELGFESGEGLFDMYSPSGRYELDMSKPYDYMVARMLLTIANKNEGCELTNVEHASGEKGGWRPIALVRRTPPVARSSSKGAQEPPSRPATTAAGPTRRGDSGGGGGGGGDCNRQISAFGERMLGGAGTVGKHVTVGDWRVPAEKLLGRCFGDGIGNAVPDDVDRFFRDLGLEPEPSISRSVSKALNDAKRIEHVLRVSPEETETDDQSSGGNAEDGTSGESAGESLTGGIVDTAPASLEEATTPAPRPGANIRASSNSPPIGADIGMGAVKTPFDVAARVFELLFSEADVDRSGCIDHAEFGELLRRLGREIGPDVAKHCLASYDIDRSNTIETCEFVDFMTHEFLVPAPPAPGVMCTASGLSSWEIPREGRLRMTVTADYVAPTPVEIASQEAVDALISNIRFTAKTEQDRLEMFQLATEGTDFYLTSLNAQAVIDEWNNGINIVDILEIMLPQMSSDRNVVSLMENNLTYAQKLELRSKLGQAWGPLVGNPTGTYCLDMSNRRHLVAARRLAMINHAEKGHDITGAAGRLDTSQRGHWNNFRNETFNGLPFPGRGLEARWFARMPSKGKLRMDYVATTRPIPGSRPISDRRFQQLLEYLDLGDMQRSTEHPSLFGTPGSPIEEAAADGGADIARARSSVGRQASVNSGQRASASSSRRGSIFPAVGVNSTLNAGPRGSGSSKASAASGPPTRRPSNPVIPSGRRLSVLPLKVGVKAKDASRHTPGVGSLSEQEGPLPPHLGSGIDSSLPSEELGDAGAGGSPRSGAVGDGFVSGVAESSALSARQEPAKRLEMAKVHAMIRSGELRPITPDQVLTFHAEYQVTSKTERRRAWAIVELGCPLVPDEETEPLSRSASIGGGGGDRNGAAAGGERTSLTSTEESKPQATGAHNDRLKSDGGLLLPSGEGLTGASEQPDSRGAPEAGGKAEVSTPPAAAESRPNFGEKQKPLHLVPLKWRKLVGRAFSTPDYKLALSKLCELRVQALRHHLTVAQVITTMSLFPRCDFLRVIVAITLFGRIVDLDNLDRLLDEFTQAEEEEFLWRIGPLNCYNPMKPDRSYDLDLTHRDDREICKILARLALDEPGENWIGEEYRWSYAQKPVPGWELPLSWTTPDSDANGGPRHFGRLTLKYSSDPSQGCSPKWKLRESLMPNVLAGQKFVQ